MAHSSGAQFAAEAPALTAPHPVSLAFLRGSAGKGDEQTAAEWLTSGSAAVRQLTSNALCSRPAGADPVVEGVAVIRPEISRLAHYVLSLGIMQLPYGSRCVITCMDDPVDLY